VSISFERQQDPEARRMAVFPERDRATFAAHWRRVLANDAATNRTVLSDGRVAGYVVSFDQDGKRLVGYWIGREFWGRGLATKALAALLEEETARSLHAWVATTNVAFMRVLEKCGFVGRRRPNRRRRGPRRGGRGGAVHPRLSHTGRTLRT
jgi:RimJ/RimL family protein N-acetyltransferase